MWTLFDIHQLKHLSCIFVHGLSRCQLSCFKSNMAEDLLLCGCGAKLPQNLLDGTTKRNSMFEQSIENLLRNIILHWLLFNLHNLNFGWIIHIEFFK